MRAIGRAPPGAKPLARTQKETNMSAKPTPEAAASGREMLRLHLEARCLQLRGRVRGLNECIERCKVDLDNLKQERNQVADELQVIDDLLDSKQY